MLVNHKLFFLSRSVTRRDPVHHFSHAGRRHCQMFINRSPPTSGRATRLPLQYRPSLGFFFTEIFFVEWSAPVTCKVLWVHILKCRSYFMTLVCINFCFIEAKLTFFFLIRIDQMSFCEGCSNFGCDWAKLLHTFLILSKCIKPLTSEGI